MKNRISSILILALNCFLIGCGGGSTAPEAPAITPAPADGGDLTNGGQKDQSAMLGPEGVVP